MKDIDTSKTNITMNFRSFILRKYCITVINIKDIPTEIKMLLSNKKNCDRKRSSIE